MPKSKAVPKPRKRKIKVAAVPAPRTESFVGGGRLPSGEPCPEYCPQCIPKDLDISSDDIELWETYSDGWTSTPICSVCHLAIPVRLDWLPTHPYDDSVKVIDRIATSLVGVDTRTVLAAVIAELSQLDKATGLGNDSIEVLHRLWRVLNDFNRWKMTDD